MEDTLVSVSELRKKGVWHFLPYSQQASHTAALLQKSPFPVQSLETLVSEKPIRGYAMVSSAAKDGVPVLSERNISSGDINFEEVDYLTPEEHEKLLLTQVQRGDVLVKLVAQPGVSAVYAYAEPANFNSHLVRLRLKPEVDPEYLVSYLNSDLGQSLIRTFTTGNLRPVVTLAALMSLPVILPPLAEQKRIALKARSLVQEVTQLRENAQERQEEARRLFSDLLEGGIE
jgi:type I restriction enzyme, S subunit